MQKNTASMKKFLKPDKKITFCRADKKDSGVNGNPFASFRDFWGAFRIFGDLWESLGTFGDLWASVWISRDLLRSLGIFADLWGSLGISGNLLRLALLKIRLFRFLMQDETFQFLMEDEIFWFLMQHEIFWFSHAEWDFPVFSCKMRLLAPNFFF